ncbi:MAG TPA: hypothetical protein VII70_04600 [Steroidobacteraceae bacterium]
MRQSAMFFRIHLRATALVAANLCIWGCSPGTAAAAPQLLEVDGVRISIEFADSDFTNGTAPLVAWISRSAGIVAAYYDRFPVKELRVRVSSQSGGGVRHGTTFGAQGAFIRITVGREVTAAELINDWVLVHEMTHLALPDVGPEHLWLSEGIAVYVEGVARVQVGNRSAAEVWTDEVRSMPRGLPQAGDAGLDHTHTWGRTYWGGALFCLLADIEIRRRTDNRAGLQTALRAIARASGGLLSDWPIERVFAVGDTAVGTTVLHDLYASAKDAPLQTDLSALWMSLGIEPEGDSAALRSDAPFAKIRDAIMRAPLDSTPREH